MTNIKLKVFLTFTVIFIFILNITVFSMALEEVSVSNGDFEGSTQSTEINANYTTTMPTNWSVADISYATPYGTDLKWSTINNATGAVFDGSTGVTATGTNVLNMYDNSSAGGIWLWSDPISISENEIYRIDVNAWSTLRMSFGIRFFDTNGKIFTPSTTSDTTAFYSLVSLATLPTTSASYGGYIRNDIPNNNYINGVGANASKWATYSKDFVAPKDAVTARVLLYTQHNFTTTQIIDWVKVSKLESKKLTISNSDFATDASGWTSNNATTTKVATGKSFVNATADVMNIVANANNASVISDEIPLYGGGKYSLNFEWRTMSASQSFNYAFKLFDSNHNEITTTLKTLTGANVATPLTRTLPIPNIALSQSDITFDVPANASYAKIYFELPISFQTLQIDNIVAKMLPDGAFRKILTPIFKNDSNEPVTLLSSVAGGNLNIEVPIVNYKQTDGDNKDIYLIAGLYNIASGNLEKLSFKKFTIKMDIDTISINIAIPQNVGTSYRVVPLLIDGFGTLKVLSEALIELN